MLLTSNKSKYFFVLALIYNVRSVILDTSMNKSVAIYNIIAASLLLSLKMRNMSLLVQPTNQAFRCVNP